MAFRVADDPLNDAVDGIVDNVDEGSAQAAGRIDFYSGSQPATLTGTPAGTLLASVDYQAPAFGDASSGSASALGVPLSTTGVGDGDIGFARVLDRDGTVRWDDDDVGTSGTRIVVNTVTVSIGVDFRVTAHTISATPQT